MSGVNKVILVGRLGTEPDVRATAGGHQVCTLSIATSETWVKDGKREEKTEWHRVVLWGRQAEIAQKYLRKGRMVYIEGKLQTRSWQDAQGQKRYSTEVVANNMQFIDGTAGANSSRDGLDSASPSDDMNASESYYGNQNTNTYDGASQSQAPSSSFNLNQMRPLDEDIPF